MVQKLRPAPIYEKWHNRYRLHFSYRGKQYKRFYITDKYEANILQAEVNRRVRLFKENLQLPSEGVSLQDFIFADLLEMQEQISPVITDIATLSELTDQYEHSLNNEASKAESTRRTEKIHLNHLRNFADQNSLSDLSIKDIKAGFFHHYKRFRYQNKVRTDTVNRELTTFQVMFQQAVDNEDLDRNPVVKVKRCKSQVPADRFRTHEEIQTMRSSGNYTEEDIKEAQRFQYLTIKELEELIALAEGKWLHPILVTYAYSGIRRGELIKLEWNDVDFEKQYLYVKSKKQSKKYKESIRTIPILNRLLPILIEQKEKTGRSKWVFTGPRGGQLNPDTLRITFYRLVENTPFEGLGYHVFRHSVASNLAEMGVEQSTIDSIMGHQTEAMRKRYQHLFPKHRKEALQKIQSLFDEIDQAE